MNREEQLNQQLLASPEIELLGVVGSV